MHRLLHSPRGRPYPDDLPANTCQSPELSMRLRGVGCVLACGTLLAAPAAAQLPPPPAGWPSQIEIGVADSPGGAAALRATAPFLFRYQYLAGGVNTGRGWSTWNPGGDFAKFYIDDSIANGMIP